MRISSRLRAYNKREKEKQKKTGEGETEREREKKKRQCILHFFLLSHYRNKHTHTYAPILFVFLLDETNIFVFDILDKRFLCQIFTILILKLFNIEIQNKILISTTIKRSFFYHHEYPCPSSFFTSSSSSSSSSSSTTAITTTTTNNSNSSPTTTNK